MSLPSRANALPHPIVLLPFAGWLGVAHASRATQNNVRGGVACDVTCSLRVCVNSPMNCQNLCELSYFWRQNI